MIKYSFDGFGIYSKCFVVITDDWSCFMEHFLGKFTQQNVNYLLIVLIYFTRNEESKCPSFILQCIICMA